LPFHSPPSNLKIRNSNIEIPAFAEAVWRRQAKQIQNSQIFKTLFRFETYVLVIRNCFEFRLPAEQIL